MKLEINIEKRHFYFLIIFVSILFVIGVSASDYVGSNGVGHDANETGPGTFGAGDYVFPNNLNINRMLYFPNFDAFGYNGIFWGTTSRDTTKPHIEYADTGAGAGMWISSGLNTNKNINIQGNFIVKDNITIEKNATFKGNITLGGVSRGTWQNFTYCDLKYYQKCNINSTSLVFISGAIKWGFPGDFQAHLTIYDAGGQAVKNIYFQDDADGVLNWGLEYNYTLSFSDVFITSNNLGYYDYIFTIDKQDDRISKEEYRKLKVKELSLYILK